MVQFHAGATVIIFFTENHAASFSAGTKDSFSGGKVAGDIKLTSAQLLGYYAPVGSLKPTFRDHLSLPFSRAKLYNEKLIEQLRQRLLRQFDL